MMHVMCAGDLLESSYVSSLINIQMEQLSLSFFLCPTRFECHQRGEGANEHNNEIQRHILIDLYPRKMKIFSSYTRNNIYILSNHNGDRTRPKASGSSSRFLTGTRQGQDRYKIGTK